MIELDASRMSRRAHKKGAYLRHILVFVFTFLILVLVLVFIFVLVHCFVLDNLTLALVNTGFNDRAVGGLGLRANENR